MSTSETIARATRGADVSNSKIVGSYFGRTLEISTANAKIEGDYVALDSLKLSTSNAEISGTFTGKSISALTSNSPLCGSFSVANSLDLATSNHSILVDVRLVADEPSTPPLLGQKSNSIGSIVKSRVVTSNGKINIAFDQPAGVRLQSEVQTSNQPIVWRSGSNYNGQFLVSLSSRPFACVADLWDARFRLRTRKRLSPPLIQVLSSSVLSARAMSRDVLRER